MTVNDAGQSNVLKFRTLVDTDPALQADVAQHVANGSWNSAAIVEIGRKAGFEFSTEDFVSVMEEDDELSDFELELVAAAAPLECVETGA
ncbi:MAG: Nif11-like leader peptide family RiPP precursor [Alphaproteobacteria bacterium]|nr:Nif11-like leader peptide family RiPP precursor [Alphaproteobacteria bacterium]MBO6864637.1 Nif11-like leader peptide family RiPP precursor [Alphaproteobacteria bacterium]